MFILHKRLVYQILIHYVLEAIHIIKLQHNHMNVYNHVNIMLMVVIEKYVWKHVLHLIYTN